MTEVAVTGDEALQGAKTRDELEDLRSFAEHYRPVLTKVRALAKARAAFMAAVVRRDSPSITGPLSDDIQEKAEAAFTAIRLVDDLLDAKGLKHLVGD